MELQEVKNNLNKRVTYKGTKGVYQFVACTLRKVKDKFDYSAVLLDTKHGRSTLTCDLKDIEVEE